MRTTGLQESQNASKSYQHTIDAAAASDKISPMSKNTNLAMSEEPAKRGIIFFFGGHRPENEDLKRQPCLFQHVGDNAGIEKLVLVFFAHYLVSPIFVPNHTCQLLNTQKHWRL